MASPFLDNLKNAVNTGEFNSEAAKKIMEIDKLADTKTPAGAEKAINKRLEEAGVKVIGEEESQELNSQYEREMEKIKTQDVVNAQIATLIEIEDLVKMTIEDMIAHVQELEMKYEKEFLEKDPVYGELSLKIEQIKSKYNIFINN